MSFELFARPGLRQMMGHAAPRPTRGRGASPTRTCRRRADGKIHFARVAANYERRRPGPRPLDRRAGQSHQLRPPPRPTPWPCCPTATASPRAASHRARVLSAASVPSHLTVPSRGDLVDAFGRVAPRPAHLGHRPLQLPLHVLHAGEGMEWLPRDELLTFEEIERVAGCCVERFGFDSIRLTGGEPTVRAHLPVLVEPSCRATLGVDLALTTNGATLAAASPTTSPRAGLRRINISLDSLRPRPVPRASPGATSSTGCSTASTPPSTPGFDPVKVNFVVDAGRQRRRGRRLRRPSAARRAYGPLHRVHAPRRRRGAGPTSRSSPRTRSSRPSAPCTRSSRCRARRRRRPSAWRYARRPGRGRRHPERHQAVLRLLRPGAAHRRGPAAQLPVRARRVRPARPRSAAARSDDDLAAAIERRGRRPSGPGHAIGQVHFIRPGRSMSQIGG